MGDSGRRDKKNEKATDQYIIEEQLVLRVPPAVAVKVKALLSKNHDPIASDLTFTMESERKGKMVIDGKNYNVTLVDLPCIVESWKTLDRILFYKSADIHQMLLVEDPDLANSDQKPDSFKVSFDAEFRLDTGLTKLTRHIRTKRWRRHPSFHPNEVARVADELSKMKRGAPVPDRFELVEVHEPVVPPAVVEAPKISLGARPAASTASVTAAPIPIPKATAAAAASVSTPLRVNTSLPPTTTPSTNTGAAMVGQSPAIGTPATPATPATGKVVFKFGKKAAAPPPTDASAPASTAPAAVPPTTAAPPVAHAPTYAAPVVPQQPIQSSSAMDVDLPPPAIAATVSAPASAPTMPAAPSGAGREQYEAKLAQRTDLARRKVAEEANRAKLTASLNEQKNAMIRKRVQDNLTNVVANIAKLDAQIAELDRELLQLGA